MSEPKKEKWEKLKTKQQEENKILNKRELNQPFPSKSEQKKFKGRVNSKKGRLFIFQDLSKG
ncbi:hypothetical protein SCA6_010365 [Theobroma cacao]